MEELLLEVYEQGVEDGLNGMHIAPHNVIEKYIKLLSQNGTDNKKASNNKLLSGQQPHSNVIPIKHFR